MACANASITWCLNQFCSDRPEYGPHAAHCEKPCFKLAWGVGSTDHCRHWRDSGLVDVPGVFVCVDECQWLNSTTGAWEDLAGNSVCDRGLCTDAGADCADCGPLRLDDPPPSPPSSSPSTPLGTWGAVSCLLGP